MSRVIYQKVFDCILFTALIIIFLPVYSQSSEEERTAKLLQKLSSGDHFAMMRHALAPGVGDPASFSLQDCSTQRNLSEKGRQQSRAIGELFRKNGLESAEIYSSQWCRCLETASLLGLGEVKELPVINSFFRNFADEGPQTKALSQWIEGQELMKPLLLVTHQVNITAFTGIYPSSGEIIIVQRKEKGDYSVVGTIETGLK